MTEKMNTFELKDDDLEQISGGKNLLFYTINVGIYHVSSDLYFQVTSQQRMPAQGIVQGIALRLEEDGKLHKYNTSHSFSAGVLSKSPTVNNLEIAN